MFLGNSPPTWIVLLPTLRPGVWQVTLGPYFQTAQVFSDFLFLIIPVPCSTHRQRWQFKPQKWGILELILNTLVLSFFTFPIDSIPASPEVCRERLMGLNETRFLGKTHGGANATLWLPCFHLDNPTILPLYYTQNCLLKMWIGSRHLLHFVRKLSLSPETIYKTNSKLSGFLFKIPHDQS